MTLPAEPYHSTTTLAEIRAVGPCGINKNDDCGWAKLLRNLGEPHGKPNLAREVTVLEILESNGLDDALWCLQVKSLDRLSRHLRAWCAEQVLPYFLAERPEDGRISARIAMLRNDGATDAARAAHAAAWAAHAADAASDAAWAAAWAAHAATRAAQEAQLRRMLEAA